MKIARTISKKLLIWSLHFPKMKMDSGEPYCWRNVDYNLVQQYSKAIFDTKNAMKEVAERENIEIL